MEQREKLVLIDGHSILNRAFYGMPDLTNSAGVHTGAVYGFLKILFRILEEEKPQYLEVAFDVSAPTFRHKVYEAYKGTRHPMPEELREQVPLIKRVLQTMRIAACERPGLEADDILGTLAKKAQAAGMEVCLVSGDRDLLQIADEHIQIRIPKTKKGQTVIENYHASDVKEALQVTPEEFIHVKALQGDVSDNIPGVPKVGPKTATELITRYHSVDGVYAHLDEITRKGLHDNLQQNEEQARLSLFLAAIKTDADVELDAGQARIGDFYTPEAFQIYTELGFKNLLGRFSKETAEAAAGLRYGGEKEETEAAESVTEERTGKEAEGADLPWASAVPIYDPGTLGQPGELRAIAFCIEGQTSFYGIAETEGRGAKEADAEGSGIEEKGTEAGEMHCVTREEAALRLRELRRRAMEGELRLAVFDLKAQLPFWNLPAEEMQGGIRLDGIFDVLLGAFLRNPLKSDYTPEDVALEYLGELLAGRQQLFGKASFRELLEKDSGGVTAYAMHLADTLAREAPVVRRRLSEDGMLALYEEIELPLTYVLYDMQRIGIHAVRERLAEYGDRLVGRIEELEQSIQKAAGHPFNPASPKQLGQVLFEEMQLPGGKKTKSGYSTAADVLEKLADEYTIAAEVLEYRGLTKLKSTYADGLQSCIAKDDRIHTTFHQTITATGRISSTEPNLQNIPMRTELGRAIRKVFLPQEGYTFLDADYSQIELRILASLSGDEALIEAYRENRDIHAATAAKVFHTPYEEVTPLQRRNAKAVNFGIVYGISSFGLSRNLDIPRWEAKEYIEEYFRMFPGIKAFLEREVSEAKEKGYSVTMFGRRRPIPELTSSNYMQRQFGERVAMNAPIQGTGADIMKRAMLRVWEALHREGLQSRLILQIHDELLIETAPGEEERVRQILTEGMMGAASLRVPLEVDCHQGSDWYEAK